MGYKANINTLDAKGEVLMTIMAALAQQESESLSANIRLGIQFRNQQGKVQVNHNRFLGYTKDEDGNSLSCRKRLGLFGVSTLSTWMAGAFFRLSAALRQMVS